MGFKSLREVGVGVGGKTLKRSILDYESKYHPHLGGRVENTICMPGSAHGHVDKLFQRQ